MPRLHPRSDSSTSIEGVPVDDLAIAAEDINARGGRLIRRGTKLRRTDPAVLESPQWFTTIPVRLIDLPEWEG